MGQFPQGSARLGCQAILAASTGKSMNRTNPARLAPYGLRAPMRHSSARRSRVVYTWVEVGPVNIRSGRLGSGLASSE